MKISRTVYIIRVGMLISLLLIIDSISSSQYLAGVVTNREKKQIENNWKSSLNKKHKATNTYEPITYDMDNSPSNNIQYRMEERHPNGSIVGSFGQLQPNGNLRVVSYVADKDSIKTYENGDRLNLNNKDQHVAQGSSIDSVQRVSSQILSTDVQPQHYGKSPLFDKYHRSTPDSQNRIDNAHAYHQQRTNIDPSSFRPEDSSGYQETNQPFVGDHLKDKLQTSYAEYRVPTTTTSPRQGLPMTVLPYNLHPTATPGSPMNPSSYYVLNVPPLPALADNSPLPLLPGQQPLPITPDRGPIKIQLQQPQQSSGPTPPTNYNYQPTQITPQHLRLTPQQQQQFIQQQYQQQPVRIQPPAHLQQLQLQSVRSSSPQQQSQQSVKISSPTPQQQQSRLVTQQVVPQQVQYQHLPNTVYQHPPQFIQPQHQVLSTPQLQQQQQQHRGQQSVPLQYFHQPNPATTLEQYSQQLQLQAAESEAHAVFVLPPDDSIFDLIEKTIRD
ncbi:uncharacterized protein LOC126904725 [Daktulosphaira vitifoliae]|uniref:uncharacterized protein LOC126904725 n=1 Tax=Daktulosphaira vitifoliae TaxID=58002 RepID=UPI0021A9C636|nr:uncharacterized protein LOC126904725 [Daktulosphaira vitifoliae]